MRQYTTPAQTAKLIELGFEKPKSISSIKVTGDIITTAEDLIGEPSSVMGGKISANYSIGELVEMLLHKPHCRVSIYNVGLGQHKVLFKKLINGKFKVLFREVGYEPIDLLFNCIIKLKEEGVI